MRYEAPDNLEQACALLAAANGAGKVLAGGTDLLVQLRGGFIEPELIVDIKHVAELRNISADSTGYIVGAAVSGAELGEHETLSTDWPGVVEAAELIGSTQIQGRASLGGNLCNASPAADSVPALIAARASAIVAGPSGRREVAVEDVIVGPGRTSLGDGEVVVGFRLGERPARSADAYLRFIPRTEMDIAVVGAGVNLSLDADGVCTDARISLGAVAEVPLVVDDAANALIGSKLESSAVEAAAAAASAACRPIDDKRGTKNFRIKVAGVLTTRSVGIAHQRALEK
ncbi:MAG: oxidoreductase [Thiotrichales bacterium]|mgnify:CR=1 FL=1|nr:oxidoreductase [Thiotrichales bacterium]